MSSMVIYPNRFLDFSRTLIMNSKNLPDNRMGLDPVSNNYPTLKAFS
jgi:hypothetical protein